MAGHGFGCLAVHTAGVLGYHRGWAVVEAPLHPGDHAVLLPLVGAGGVGTDPAGGDGHGGDDHAAAKVEHQVLADVAAVTQTQAWVESGPATAWAAVEPGRHPTEVAV